MTKQMDLDLGGSFTLPGTSMTVNRMGYGAMQLAGPQVWGPPRDVDAAIAVLREAVAAGVNHIDTSDFYGPHVTNQIIKQALHPYPDGLVIVTKVGARRGEDKSWIHALSRQELIDGVHDNLRTWGSTPWMSSIFALEAVMGPSEGSIEEPLTVLAELKRQGLIRHLGLSNVSPEQLAEAQKITEIVCVQNFYNVAHRDDDGFIDDLAEQGIAYVPFFPLGGFTPLQSSTLDAAAASLQATPDAGCAGVASSALAEYPADPRHIFGQTSARESQGCNAATSFRNDRRSGLDQGRRCAVISAGTSMLGTVTRSLSIAAAMTADLLWRMLFTFSVFAISFCLREPRAKKSGSVQTIWNQRQRAQAHPAGIENSVSEGWGYTHQRTLTRAGRWDILAIDEHSLQHRNIAEAW